MTERSLERRLRVLVADERYAALQETVAALRALGHTVADAAVDLAEISEAVAREEPEVAVVVLHGDEQHALEMIAKTVTIVDGPVICALSDHDAEFSSAAASRGVYACVEEGDPEALQAAFEVALERHRDVARREREVDQLQLALERRALIERAKGILMERHAVDDRVAFERLRRYARSHNQKVIDVAARICRESFDPPDDED